MFNQVAIRAPSILIRLLPGVITGKNMMLVFIMKIHQKHRQIILKAIWGITWSMATLSFGITAILSMKLAVIR